MAAGAAVEGINSYYAPTIESLKSGGQVAGHLLGKCIGFQGVLWGVFWVLHWAEMRVVLRQGRSAMEALSGVAGLS